MSDKSLSRTTGTRVTTGKQLFLERVDERSLVARRYREVLGSIVSDLGGSDAVSEAELILARRAASLVVVAEQYESRMADGGKLDLESYMPVVNTLMRLLSTLGLKRRPKHVSPSPLEGYHAANASRREPEVVDAEPERHEPLPARRINEAIAAVANGSDSRPRRIIRAVRN